MSLLDKPYFSSAKKLFGGGKKKKKKSIEYFMDATDNLANNYGLYLSIYGTKTKTQMNFKAFLDNFSDNYDLGMDQKGFVGDSAPDYRVGRVTRKVDIGVSVISASTAQAKLHMQNLNLLVQSLYPVSDQYGGIASVTANKFKIKLLNLLADSTFEDISTVPTNAVQAGLEGYIDDLNYEFDMESGFLTDHEERGYVYPKLIRLTFSFYPHAEAKAPKWLKQSGKDEIQKFSLGSGYPYSFAGLRGFIKASGTGATVDSINEQNKARIERTLGQ